MRNMERPFLNFKASDVMLRAVVLGKLHPTAQWMESEWKGDLLETCIQGTICGHVLTQRYLAENKHTTTRVSEERLFARGSRANGEMNAKTPQEG